MPAANRVHPAQQHNPFPHGPGPIRPRGLTVAKQARRARTDYHTGAGRHVDTLNQLRPGRQVAVEMPASRRWARPRGEGYGASLAYRWAMSVAVDRLTRMQTDPAFRDRLRARRVDAELRAQRRAALKDGASRTGRPAPLTR